MPKPHSPWRNTSAALALLLIMLGACAPGAAPTSTAPAGGSDGTTAAGPVRSAAPKVLTVAIQREPKALVDRVNLDNSRGGGISHVFNIAHNHLAIMDDHGEFIPQLAVELPSVEKGTWRVAPDGSMDVTWKLHPNVRWHDGTPFTADDVVFSFNVFKDPDIQTGFGQDVRDMRAVTAPDPQTVVVHWTRTRIDATEAPALTPLARHLFEELYLTDKENFTRTSKLTTDFVGLGAFRVARWEAGSHVDFVGFDGYFRGKPALDRVVLRFLPDPNAMVANILAGSIDVLLPLGVSVDAAVEVEERWKGTGNVVIFNPGDRTEIIFTNQRPEQAQPRNGFPNPVVRQAFFHATDRQALIETITYGKSPLADSWLNARDPVLAQVNDAIPKYPYDLARAQDLLRQAGWVRGADGTLVHQPSGERFDVNLHTSAASDAERKLNIIADGWKGVGAQVQLQILAATSGASTADRGRMPGAGQVAYSSLNLYQDMLYSRGRQAVLQGYQNPRYDALIERLITTLSPAERIPIHRDLVALAMGEVALMPLHYRIDPYFHVKSVKNVRGHPNTESAWNIFDWDNE